MCRVRISFDRDPNNTRVLYVKVDAQDGWTAEFTGDQLRNFSREMQLGQDSLVLITFAVDLRPDVIAELCFYFTNPPGVVGVLVPQKAAFRVLFAQHKSGFKKGQLIRVQGSGIRIVERKRD